MNSRYQGRLTAAQIAEIKSRIFSGHSQVDIALEMNVSQPTVSRIKSGVTGHNIPWPDGSTGALPNRAPLRHGEAILPPNVIWWEGWKPQYQERILKAVNLRRQARGEEQIPPIAAEMEAWLSQSPMHPDDEQEAGALARNAERARICLVVDEFQEICQEIRERKTAEFYRINFREYKHVVTDAERAAIASRPPAPMPDYPTYKCMDWDKILATAPTNKLLRDIESNPVRKVAIQILFFNLPLSDWSEPVAARLVDSTEAWLRTFPKEVARLESELSCACPRNGEFGHLPECPEGD